MTSGPPVVRRYETYWRAYFEELDRCAGQRHPESRVNFITNYRKITSYTCNDGVLFDFDEGDKLSFTHAAVQVDVQQMVHNILPACRFRLVGDYCDLGPFQVGRTMPDLGEAALPLLKARLVSVRGSQQEILTARTARTRARQSNSQPMRHKVGTRRLDS